MPILFKRHKVVYNIYLEGAVSQTLLIFQTKVSTFDKTQTKTYIKNLRQASFHVTRVSTLIDRYQIKKCKLKSSFSNSNPSSQNALYPQVYELH